MRFKLNRLTANIDWWLMATAIALTVLGLVLIYSLTWPQERLFLKQLIVLFFGIGLVFLMQGFDKHFWRNVSAIFYALIVVLLAALLVIGDTTRGIHGWFYLGPLALQPAEFAKIACVMFLATTLEKLNFDIANIKHLILVLALAALPITLVALQPDFGSAFVMAAVSAIMILYTGLSKRVFFILFIGGILVAGLAWFGFLHDYQKNRILTFVNPQADPLGTGYNVRQSMVAIGSGGLLGRGLGLGTQSQLNFLPEQETDFIFAALAEELGFVGALSVFILYLFILRRLWLAIKAGADLFSNFLILGILSIFLVQAVVNIGMNMGLFPVTGITLPLVSYGGSSLLASFLCLGLAQAAPRNSA
ncbi:MAG: rod shape-determining protein RodA [Candidatus Komeilibacteria bacterium]|nr:rod shape-determining protein RodA [Candidatus Komeilibacteria bacterium]